MTKRLKRGKKAFKATRTFNGEVFGARYEEKKKKTATKTARELRKEGNKVRIIKVGKNYVVYGRRT